MFEARAVLALSCRRRTTGSAARLGACIDNVHGSSRRAPMGYMAALLCRGTPRGSRVSPTVGDRRRDHVTKSSGARHPSRFNSGVRDRVTAPAPPRPETHVRRRVRMAARLVALDSLGRGSGGRRASAVRRWHRRRAVTGGGAAARRAAHRQAHRCSSLVRLCAPRSAG